MFNMLKLDKYGHRTYSPSRFQKVNHCSGILLCGVLFVCSVLRKSVKYIRKKTSAYKSCIHLSNWTNAADRSRQDFFGYLRPCTFFGRGGIRL